ncbi:(E,E)-geranyllinalool synthase-like isoform X2 [Magnolia sinica]|uniref:(E,E)-geranyllinalool synthase-like isoform X2 n=1 Tax=Magnolia sinica TaxID=86752 RepID=UPI0026593F80|nr:(E,E)-geranyllinalool synthase-like isoform X2 [Magnolia sinica]
MESIEGLVKEIKEEIFSPVDLYCFVVPSAYDTAWMAMIPHPQHPNRPMFYKCLDWILSNQREEGFWGEPGQSNAPTIQCLSATLACMVALKRWNVGSTNIVLGLQFIHANTDKLLREEDGCYPRQFAIVFPAMIELAQAAALDIFPDGFVEVVDDIFCERQRILEMVKCTDQAYYPPLSSYMEALPETYVSPEHILEHQSEDGSLFQSPSATAHAFMATRDKNCMVYLESVVQRCKDGVPPVYPIDEELIKLCMVDRLERLGLAEYFQEEIEEVLCGVYRNWRKQESEAMIESIAPQQIFKDSLSFRMLRMNGYRVSPRRFCWFLQNEDIIKHIEENYEYFSTAMLNVYKATELMFLGENELEDARTFSRKLLERGMAMRNVKNSVATSNNQEEIEHELMLPWLARLDHLEHRVTIERTEKNCLWMEKASYYRLSFLNNSLLLQLAKDNYTQRQLIFMNELEELTRWSKESGLRDIGFGREKTTYCYLAIAAVAYSPSLSDLRMVAAKSAILVTVIDDFFDMEGSMDELNQLTEAIRRWDVEGLSDHSKIIFDALNNLINHIAEKSLDKQGRDVTDNLRGVKEEADGKMNIVLLYMKENPGAHIKDSIAGIRKILDVKKKELLELVLMDDSSNMPKACKQLHLSCLKVFQMFFNSNNGYDSPTEMQDYINKAIYDPLMVQVQHSLQQEIIQAHYGLRKENASLKPQIARSFQDHCSKISTLRKITRLSPENWCKISHDYTSPRHTGIVPFEVRQLNLGGQVHLKFRLRSYPSILTPHRVAKPLFWL